MANDRPLAIVVLPRQARLDRLVTVIPVAQTQRHAGVELLALAVEVYTAGWLVTLQAQSHAVVPFIDTAPTLALTVSDDCGKPYNSHAYGGTGEGAGSNWQWRLAYRGAPALDPHARILRLVVTTLTWTRPNYTTQQFIAVRTVTGPWRFEVDLLP